MLEPQQLPFMLAGTVLMTLQPMLVQLSKNKDGKFDYSPVISTLFTEIFKIVISSTLLWTSDQIWNVKLDIKELFRFSIPAIIYGVNNNLVFYIMLYVNPTTFQLLSQMKIVFTGLLFRVFLGRKLTGTQYLAIWFLTCGTATSHIPLCATNDDSSSYFGLILSVVSCFLSACGGIYSEKLLKDNSVNSSVHWQNIQLYSWGCLFNLIGACIQNPDVVMSSNAFEGFNGYTVAVVINNSLNGLAISAILKYADNIARVYAHSAAMILTMVLSVMFFGQAVTPQLLIAVALVSASGVQYNMAPPSAPPKAEPAKSSVPAASIPRNDRPAQEAKLENEDDDDGNL